MDFTDRDNGLAWQLLAGVYMPISENIDVGLKYRYFHPHGFDFNGEQLGYTRRRLAIPRRCEWPLHVAQHFGKSRL